MSKQPTSFQVFTLLNYIKRHSGTFGRTTTLVKEIIREYNRMWESQGETISERQVYDNLRTPYLRIGKLSAWFLAAVNEATGIEFTLEGLSKDVSTNE